MEENNKNQDSITKDHVSILLEEIKKQGQTVAEQYSSLSKKVDLIADDMDHVKSDVIDIKLELKIMNGKLANKAEKEVVIDHEKRLVGLETALPKVA